jgi:hypothetical protein
MSVHAKGFLKDHQASLGFFLRRQDKPSAHRATVGNAQLHVLRLSMGHAFNPSLHDRG